MKSLNLRNHFTIPIRESHAKLIRSYNNITEYLTYWLPHIKKKIKDEGEKYLTDVYQHDIPARVVLPGVISNRYITECSQNEHTF